MNERKKNIHMIYKSEPPGPRVAEFYAPYPLAN